MCFFLFVDLLFWFGDCCCYLICVCRYMMLIEFFVFVVNVGFVLVFVKFGYDCNGVFGLIVGFGVGIVIVVVFWFVFGWIGFVIYRFYCGLCDNNLD